MRTALEFSVIWHDLHQQMEVALDFLKFPLFLSTSRISVSRWVRVELCLLNGL